MKLTFLNAGVPVPVSSRAHTGSLALYRLDVLVAALSAVIVAGTICTVAATHISA